VPCFPSQPSHSNLGALSRLVPQVWNLQVGCSVVGLPFEHLVWLGACLLDCLGSLGALTWVPFWLHSFLLGFLHSAGHSQTRLLNRCSPMVSYPGAILPWVPCNMVSYGLTFPGHGCLWTPSPSSAHLDIFCACLGQFPRHALIPYLAFPGFLDLPLPGHCGCGLTISLPFPRWVSHLVTLRLPRLSSYYLFLEHAQVPPSHLDVLGFIPWIVLGWFPRHTVGLYIQTC